MAKGYLEQEMTWKRENLIYEFFYASRSKKEQIGYCKKTNKRLKDQMQENLLGALFFFFQNKEIKNYSRTD